MSSPEIPVKRGRLAGLTVLLGAAACALLLTSRPTVAVEPSRLNVPAPDLLGGPWLNTANGRPVSLGSRRGTVTIVDFWTFG